MDTNLLLDCPKLNNPTSPFLEERLHPEEKSMHHLFNIAKDVRETGLGNGGSTPSAPPPPRTPTPAASIITKCTAQVAAGLAAASLQIQISGGARSLHPRPSSDDESEFERSRGVPPGAEVVAGEEEEEEEEGRMAVAGRR